MDSFSLGKKKKIEQPGDYTFSSQQLSNFRKLYTAAPPKQSSPVYQKPDNPLESAGKFALGVGKFFAENTAKLANTGYQGVVKPISSLAFGQSQEDVAKNLNKDLFSNAGGLLDAGTFFPTKEKYEKATSNPAEFAKAFTAAGVATGAEVIPGVRGVNIAMKAGKPAQKIIRGSLEGAVYGGAGTGAQQYLDTGKLDAKGIALGTAAGGTLGGAIPGAVVGYNKLKNVVRPKVSVKTPEITSNELQNTIQKAQDSLNINNVSKKAVNSLENDITGIKPNGVQRAGGFVENGNAKPVEVRKLPDGSITVVDGRHSLEYARQNGINDFPVVDVTNQYDPKLSDKVTKIIKNSEESKLVAKDKNLDSLTEQTDNLPVSKSISDKSIVNALKNIEDRIGNKSVGQAKIDKIKEISAKTGITEEVLIREARRRKMSISRLEQEAAKVSDATVNSKDALFTSNNNKQAALKNKPKAVQKAAEAEQAVEEAAALRNLQELPQTNKPQVVAKGGPDKPYIMPDSNSTNVDSLSDKDLKFFSDKGYTSIVDRNGNKRNITPTNQVVSNELNSLNPTGGILTDYNPGSRATAQLGKDMTTLAETANIAPDELVTVYRGAPKNQTDIAPGDFITTNKELAQSYTGDNNILESKVRASEILDSRTEPGGEEYIYRPDTKPKVTKKVPDNVDPNTGEIFDTPQVDQFTANLESAKAKAAQEISDINAQVEQAGFNPDELREKMTAANRGEYQLTPEEADVAQIYTDRLNQARNTLEDAGVNFSGEQKFYTPQAKKGSKLPSSREELTDFGFNKKRENKIGADELDYGDNPQIDYIVKAENRDLLLQKVTNDAAIIDGRDMSPEAVKVAASETNNLLKKIKDKSQSEGVLKNDTVKDLHKIGEAEGYQQVNNDFEPGVLAQEPKAIMEQAGVWDKGFEQYDNARGYASEFVRILDNNKVPDSQVGEALVKSLRSSMPNADKSSIDSAVSYVTGALERNGLKATEAVNVFNRAFENVAKAELFKLGKTTNFTGNKMRKVINEQINGRVLADSYRKNAAQSVDSFLAERINVSLRGANIVSAMFELGDVANVFSKYGVKDISKAKLGLGKVNGNRFGMSDKYGQSNIHYASNDIPQVTALNKIWDNPNTSLGRKVYESYRTGENKLLFFKYIEEMKTELFFRTADNFYSKKGFQGKELVNKVMEDYHKTMLPNKLATGNRIVGKLPKVTTQYLNWSLQATKRLGRTFSGSDKGGKFADLTRGERVTRGIATEVAPKVVVAAALGVPIMQVLGMRDFTGATGGDFTGIDAEDKNITDEIVTALSLSPALSTAANFYFADRRNKIATQRGEEGETYKATPREEDQPLNVALDSAKMLVPFQTQFNKTKQVLDAADRGYYENRDGRIQLEGPKGSEVLTGAITGKTYTPSFRKYQDTPDLIDVIKGDESVPNLFKKNQSVSSLVQTLGGDSPNEYQRPLSGSVKDSKGKVILKGYSDTAKEAFEAANTKYGKNSEKSQEVLQDWLKNGRAYNDVYNEFKKVPGSQQLLDKYYGDNIITPEKWRLVQGNDKVWNYLKDRKKLEARDLDRDIDPIYNLNKKKANEVLAERASYTGDDMRKREMLYQTDWYGKFKDAETKYYDTFTGGEDLTNKTKRVKEWKNLSEQVFSPDKGLQSSDKYKLIKQYNDTVGKFKNYDSDERKAFTSAWYKANPNYSDLKQSYELERLKLVNKMRKIEGVPALTEKQFLAKTNFPTKDSDGKWTTSKYGSGSSWGSRGSSSTKTLNERQYAISVNAGGKSAKPTVKAHAASKKAGRYKARKRRTLPKATLKKSLV